MDSNMLDGEIMGRGRDVTVAAVSASLRRRLAPVYGEGEARAMTNLIFHHLKGWSVTDMVINADQPLSPYILEKIAEIEHRLSLHEPLQYILGESRFYGMDLHVTPDTLIPRPETEELVDLIVEQNGKRVDLSVLDIGTGSGAIAIALSRNLPFSRVSALDISEAALKVAQENAKNLHARIDFIHADIFRYEPAPESLDIIVSNPPYIAEEERCAMERNVLEYEPAGALFVPDAQPLIFYSRIAETARTGLKQGGLLYFEINPRFADSLEALLDKEGFRDIERFKDISHRIRFMACKKL